MRQIKETTLPLSLELRVLVTGVGGPAGKATVHFFKQKRSYVLGTDIRQVETEATDFFKILPAVDPSYIFNLLSLIEEFGISLLVPTVTEELVVVSQAKEMIKELGCQVFIPSPEYTKIANDKFLTAQFLKAHGIPTPRTVLQEEINSWDDLIEDFGLPVPSKPRFGRGGRGVTVYHSLDELHREKREGLVFQEYLPGEEYNANTFSFEGGKIVKNCILKKTPLEHL